MAYGMIKKIQEDSPGTFSGSLWDLDTQKVFDFSGEKGLEEINRLDVVSYNDAGGTATGLKPVIQVRVSTWNQQPDTMQSAIRAMLKAMTTNPLDIDVIAKKF